MLVKSAQNYDGEMLLYKCRNRWNNYPILISITVSMTCVKCSKEATSKKVINID